MIIKPFSKDKFENETNADFVSDGNIAIWLVHLIRYHFDYLNIRIDQELLFQLFETGLIIDDVPNVFDKNVKNRTGPENNDPENEAFNFGTFFVFFLHFCSFDSLTVSRFDGHNHYLACFGVVVDVNFAVANSNQFPF